MPFSGPTMAALAVLTVVASPAAGAQIFTDAPISCGFGSQYKECRATFDGRNLRIHYNHPEGKHSIAIYGKCIASDDEIHCIDGEWRSAIGSGTLGSRSFGLKDGKPFAR